MYSYGPSDTSSHTDFWRIVATMFRGGYKPPCHWDTTRGRRFTRRMKAIRALGGKVYKLMDRWYLESMTLPAEPPENYGQRLRWYMGCAILDRNIELAIPRWKQRRMLQTLADRLSYVALDYDHTICLFATVEEDSMGYFIAVDDPCGIFRHLSIDEGPPETQIPNHHIQEHTSC